MRASGGMSLKKAWASLTVISRISWIFLALYLIWSVSRLKRLPLHTSQVT